MNDTQMMFYGLYARHLGEAVAAQPKRYAYTVGEVDRVARRMTEMLAKQSGIVSPTVRRVCSELGVPPTPSAIAAFLNSQQH